MAIKVIVYQQDALDKSLRIFNAKCKKAKLFTLMQKQEHYVSPSERRHKKKIHRTHR
jgi:ribosomal protein S21